MGSGGEIVRVNTNSTLTVERARDLLAQAKVADEAKDLRDKAEAMRVYLRECGAGADAVADAAEIVERANIRFGQLWAAQPKAKGTRGRIQPGMAGHAGGADTAPPATPFEGGTTLADLGLDGDRGKKYSARCQKLARLAPDAQEAHIQKVRNKALREANAGSIGATSDCKDYDGDEWYTPPHVIQLARAVMGGIDVDPASNARAQETVRATIFYTKETNGLAKEWAGRVFCNPPYSTELIQKFTSKLLAEYDCGRTTEAVYLVNNCTDAGWCQGLLRRFDVCFTAGRISFLDRTGQKFATRQGQAIFYLGPNQERFARAFTEIGTVVRFVDVAAELRVAS